MRKVLKMQSENTQFDHAKNHLRKVRSHAVQRFCETYCNLKWNYELKESSSLDPLTLSLSELVKNILQRSPRLSKATAYDHAHAVKFCEMITILRPATTFKNKIGDKPFIVSDATMNKLTRLLIKQNCNSSEFLERVIQKEFENTFML